MEYEVYHDESKESGYWHALLFVPLSTKTILLKQLSTARENTRHYDYISYKNIRDRRGSTVLKLAETWIQIGVAALRHKQKGLYPIYLGKQQNHRRIYDKNPELIQAKFAVFRDTQNLNGFSEILDFGDRVETSFRAGLKSAMHYLGHEDHPINIAKIHFDGYEHYHRHVDFKRTIQRIGLLREYASIASSPDMIDDRTGNFNKPNPQDINNCELLQFTDILLGAFRGRILINQRTELK